MGIEQSIERTKFSHYDSLKRNSVVWHEDKLIMHDLYGICSML